MLIVGYIRVAVERLQSIFIKLGTLVHPVTGNGFMKFSFPLEGEGENYIIIGFIMRTLYPKI
jgi:hypothetical protein